MQGEYLCGIFELQILPAVSHVLLALLLIYCCHSAAVFHSLLDGKGLTPNVA